MLRTNTTIDSGTVLLGAFETSSATLSAGEPTAAPKTCKSERWPLRNKLCTATRTVVFLPPKCQRWPQGASGLALSVAMCGKERLWGTAAKMRSPHLCVFLVMMRQKVYKALRWFVLTADSIYIMQGFPGSSFPSHLSLSLNLSASRKDLRSFSFHGPVMTQLRDRGNPKHMNAKHLL